VLYLEIGCCHRVGRNISTHLIPVYGTAGAFAYMLSPAFARKALEAATDRRLNTWVDLLLMVSCQQRHIATYTADSHNITCCDVVYVAGAALCGLRKRGDRVPFEALSCGCTDRHVSDQVATSVLLLLLCLPAAAARPQNR
jgi:hypothetical protein